MVWLLTHPPLPSACVSPPFWNQRWGGNTRMRVKGGGANSDDWRESLALCLLCLSLMDENLTEKSAKLVIDHVANKSVHYVSVGTFF